MESRILVAHSRWNAPSNIRLERAGTPATALGMETPRPSSAALPDSLRAARQRAEELVAQGLVRQQELESSLSGQLEQISKLIVDDLESRQEDAAAVEEIAQERARQDFAQLQQEWEQQRNALTDEIAARDEQLEQIRSELEDCRGRLAEQDSGDEQNAAWLAERDQQITDLQQQLQDLHDSQNSRDEELNHANQQADELRNQLDELQSRHDAQCAELDSLQNEHGKSAEETHALSNQLDEAQRECERLAAERDNANESNRHEHERLQGELEQTRSEAQQQAAEHQEEVAGLRMHLDQLSSQQEQAAGEHQQDRSRLEEELVRAKGELDQASETHRQETQRLNDQLAEYEAKLRDASDQAGTSEGHTAELRQRLEQVEQERAAATAERDQLRHRAAELKEALQHAADNSKHGAKISHDFERLKKEFLATRQQNAELQAKLAAVSGEGQRAQQTFDALAGERDALRDQLAAMQAKLENQPGEAGDASRIEELEQRLAMSIDDLRELKVENERLQEELSSGSRALPVGDDSALDWEAQKRRLLESLEGEGDVDDQRQQEQLKISQVIEQTDRRVAALESELEELRLRPTTDGEIEPQPAVPDTSQFEAAADADSYIQEQRTRLAQIEQEMGQKLRQTETELSVERAKIAREQQELANWRIELETLREQLSKAAGSTEKPRRRWLDQLGLTKSGE